MIQMLSIVPYRRATRDEAVYPRLARTVPADRWDALFDRGWLGLTLFAGVTLITVGAKTAVILLASHVGTYFLLQGLVNALCHTRLEFDSSRLRLAVAFEPTNRPLVALLTLGEGLHRNHHESQSSAKMSVHPNEIDPGWFLISALSHTGQAYVLRPQVAG